MEVVDVNYRFSERKILYWEIEEGKKHPKNQNFISNQRQQKLDLLENGTTTYISKGPDMAISTRHTLWGVLLAIITNYTRKWDGKDRNINVH